MRRYARMIHRISLEKSALLDGSSIPFASINRLYRNNHFVPELTNQQHSCHAEATLFADGVNPKP
jgi:hypothetical protein